MATNHDAALCRTMLQAISKRTLQFDFTVWQWGDAIAIDGLLEAAELLHDSTYLEFVADFYRNWSARTFSWTDHLCPGRGLLKVYAATGEPALLEAAQRLASWLQRVPHAALTNVPLYRPDLGSVRGCVWVDTIYHEPSFFCELAKITHRPEYYETALDIWFSHVETLTTACGPFLHHAVDTGLHAYKGYGWGRGQGWALYGMIDTLELLPETSPRYAEARIAATSFASHILSCQDASGFWRTLIHDREAYLETSTCAFFGAAFTRGVRLGLFDAAYEEAANRAWAALVSRVDMPTGDVRGVSAWTHAGNTLDDHVSMYKTLPTEVNWWGQGSAMRFVAERLRSSQ